MDLKVNGETRHFDGDGERLLVDFIRDDLGLRAAKVGCSPQANCGTCCVLVDGRPQLSCAVKMRRAEGADVVTLEGIEGRVRDALADAMADHGGAQCGFCTPGIVVRAAALLAEQPAPDRETIAKALDKHICRCTGYVKILDAIEAAGASLRGAPVAAPSSPAAAAPAGVGARLRKLDARELALGQRAFVADLVMDGMLHGALVLSEHARARVLDLRLDAAAAMPGVQRILTAADVPGQRTIGLIRQDWPLLVAVGETTRYVGDVLAIVVADSRDAARAAAAAVAVDYEVLAPVVDMMAAMAPDAPAVHEGGNVLDRCAFVRGDVDAALAGAAHVVQQRYQTQRIEHAYLEPECCVARPTETGVRIWSQSQGIYSDRTQIAKLLGLQEADVEVVLVPNGGGFGGKEDLSVQGHTALAARTCGAPVRIELTRDESIRLHPKRHPITMDYTVACDANGRLLAVRARMVGDTGAYASVGMKVLERAAGHSTGAYHVDNVDVEAVTVYTNNVPCGAFRGFGANQANFAMESAIDELCELGGFDRWQMRWDNALTEGRQTATGQVLEGGVGVRACLEAVRPAFEAAEFAGIAAGIKNTGIGNGKPDEGRVELVVRSADHVEIRHGWTDMGQGADTMAVQFTCEETGLPAAVMRVVVDSRHQVVTGMTTASRATSLLGLAIADAGRSLKADLEREGGLGALVGRRYPGFWICDWTTAPGAPGPVKTHYSYAYAAQVAIADADGSIRRVVAAHDAGRVVNPTLFEGQIQGSVHMGLGYALREDLPCDEDGWPVSTRIKDCGVLMAHETPEIEVVAVEVADPIGAHGVKGVGEIGLVPTAPAVAGAIWAATGERRRSLPLQPMRRRNRRKGTWQ
ncbi:MAG: putative aldehyde oxidase/xanthine dehydrogenase [Pseudomonadota bacterium]|jgi:xanthine dehydrogenase molybdenum-binding subunit